jgi:hypothetical protein
MSSIDNDFDHFKDDLSYSPGSRQDNDSIGKLNKFPDPSIDVPHRF